jgi:hypothetical protein
MEQSFATTIRVDQTPQQVFNAVNNVRGWWSEEIEGSTTELNAVFYYHYKDVHRCTIKIIEMIPFSKIVWLVLDNRFNFTKDAQEWTNTRISFEITEPDGKTQLRFQHIGLVPAYECYDICREAWGNFIGNSLYNLVATGKGQPNPKEGGFNEEITEKWNLNDVPPHDQ